MSLVVVAIVWQFIYNPSFGLLTSGMNAAGLGKATRAWLGDESTALPAVGVVFVWYIVGFYITLFAAGLRTIPGEVHEAAQLDGAHGLQKFWRVTWPMLWAVKRVAAVYLIVNVLNIFALVYLTTQGGPDRKTEVILTYLYESAFKNNQFGYATAIAVVNFILAMALCGLVLFLYRRNPEAARA